MTRKSLPLIMIAGVVGILLTLAVLWFAGLLGPPVSVTTTPAAPGTTAIGTVSLDPDEVTASGIVVTLLKPATARASTDAVATVVDLTPLADLISTASSAAAQLRTAQSRSAASSAAYTRDKALYADNQNVSQAELQGAAASATADIAAADAARTSLRSAAFALEQQFGPVIGRWPLGPIAQSLAARRQVLIQISTPADVRGPPQKVTLALGNGRPVAARYVSAAVRTDPRVQGASYFYVAPADPALLAGSTLGVALPQGPQLTGVLVPSEAVIIWQGESWAYQRIAAGRFRRAPVSTGTPVDGGYLDPSIAPGTALVTRGAQLLLSQEMQPPPGAAPAGGDPDD
ncbi:MAG: hypothetical protein KGM83_10795 [Betaproteobacteria bacterium]|nr:hypothetical protein [Betaproteobacteria bacterium]